MEAVPGCNHLYRRGGVYWFRRRAPQGLESLLGVSEWRESLRTSDFEEAKARCRRKAVETDQAISVARAKKAGQVAAPLTEAEARALARNELADWLATDEAWRLTDGPHANTNAALVLDEKGAEFREALAMGSWAETAPQAVQVLQREGRWYPEGDASIRLLAGELLKVRVEWVEALSRRQRGEVVPTPQPLVVVPGPVVKPGGVTVQQLIDAFRAERIAKYGDESTDRKYKHIFEALKVAIGAERPIRGITRADCRAVRDLLRTLPVYMGRRYPGLSMVEAAVAADKDGAARLAPTTVASYLNNLTAMFNWAVEEEWIERNPAQGLSERAAATVRRRGFTADELGTLFQSLVGERSGRRWRYWVPALALYSGARAGELCQLTAADVIQADGVPCLDLSEFDAEGVRAAHKSLKTEHSERVIPIHPALIAAGFITFVEERRREDGPQARLFPELKQGPNGGWSHDLSKWFGAHLDEIGMSEPALVFHSFRHGFRDACRRARISEETADRLGGWATPGQGAGYGTRGQIAVLLRALRRISFGDFRLPR